MLTTEELNEFRANAKRISKVYKIIQERCIEGGITDEILLTSISLMGEEIDNMCVAVLCQQREKEK